MPSPADGPKSRHTRELVECAIGGDTEAEARLFGSLEPKLRSHLRCHRSLPRSEEDDAVQEVWLRFLQARALGYYLEHDTSPGVLLRILLWHARRVVVDLGRRRYSLRNLANEIATSIDRVLGETDGGPSAAPLCCDATQSSNARAMEILGIARDTLLPEENRVWRLRALAGLSFADIGKRVGKTEAQVRPLHHRARRKLMQRLASGGEEV